MRKILLMLGIVALASCNDEVKVESATDVKDEEVNYPYPILYSAKFEKGDPKLAQAVTQLWKHWDEGDLMKGRELFADSVVMRISNGMTMEGPRDSVLKWTQDYRSMYPKMESRVDAITYLHSTDKDENWAHIWGMETSTDQNGKVDSVYMHEAWRFDKNGKINLMLQYTRAGTPPAH
ncbi:MAG: nuclear transport factor 2 family protein [Flavisolibacter sp.]